MINEGGLAAVKTQDPAKIQVGRPLKEPPPSKVEVPADSVELKASPVRTDEERQQGAVAAAKAALLEAGAAVGPDQRERVMEKAGNAALTTGKALAGAAGGSHIAERLKEFGKGFVRATASNHPAVAIARGAVRMVPIAGFLVGAADMEDFKKTWRDPQAPTSQKIFAGVKAMAGLATIGAAGLLVGTGAAAFLPYVAATGALALVADVALSRLRTGHW